MKTSTFATRLVQAMKDADINSAELCRRCSLSKSTLSQYRSGLYEAKHDRVVQLAQALGCSPEWLAGEDVPMTAPEEQNTAFGTVPVLGRISLRGDGLFAAENIVGSAPAEERFCDGQHFMIIAEGDSMEPVICTGEQLLCVRQATLNEGELGVFLLPGGDWVVRTLRSMDDRLMLVSFNCYYPPRSIDAFGEVHVVGRVIRSTRSW